MKLRTIPKAAEPEWSKKQRHFSYHNRPAKMPRRLLFCIDNGKHSYSELVAISHARYATRVGATLVTIRHMEDKGYPIVWEKFRILPWLQQDYTVLCIDNDAVITDACPDLFYSFSGPHLYAACHSVIHDPYMQVTGETPKDAATIEHACKRLGIRPIDGPNINAGAFLAHPKTSWIFEGVPNPCEMKDFTLYEQDFINARIRQKPSVWKPLPAEANVWRPTPGITPWIVHAAGRTGLDKYKLLAQFV